MLNMGAVATEAEMSQFRLDTVAVATHLKTSFPWLYVSPKLHTLLCHAADVLKLFGSIGLYGEQGLEAWHGTYNHARDRYPEPIEAERAAGFVRAMALSRDASPAVLRRHAPRRKPAHSGARRAAKVDDKRRRDNKHVVEETESLKDKAKREREKWSGNLWVDAARTIRTYQSRRAIVGSRAQRISALPPHTVTCMKLSPLDMGCLPGRPLDSLTSTAGCVWHPCRVVRHTVTDTGPTALTLSCPAHVSCT